MRETFAPRFTYSVTKTFNGTIIIVDLVFFSMKHERKMHMGFPEAVGINTKQLFKELHTVPVTSNCVWDMKSAIFDPVASFRAHRRGFTW